MTNNSFLIWFLLCFLILIIIINVYSEESENRFHQQSKNLSDLAHSFSLNHNRMNGLQDENETSTTHIFPPCVTGNERDCQWPLGIDVYDKKTGTILLHKSTTKKRLYPNSWKIPQTCGFGRLVYDTESMNWSCQCLAPNYFGGDYCNIPGEEMTLKRKCRQVAQFDDVTNFDISTFNPLTNGICVECTNPATMIPLADGAIPSCVKEEEEEEDKENIKERNSKHPCSFDALNPQSMRTSPLNQYVDETYGCQCDYQNGFVEIVVPNDNATTGIKSIACVKLGKSSNVSVEDFHRADVAFYCIQNSKKPIQVHSYTELEYPFNKIFDKDKYQELLVVQEAHDIVHKHDWLNRNVRPSKYQKIRRLKYPKDSWPVVHKSHLVNKYERRLETRNVSTWDLSLGGGFETKHWYETTNNRWLSNAIWGTPIVYANNATETIWNGKSTLNPLGVKNGWYYGLTMNTRQGEIVKLDTRGYKQETAYINVFTKPPDAVHDMMDPEAIIYLPFLYTTYDLNEIN